MRHVLGTRRAEKPAASCRRLPPYAPGVGGRRDKPAFPPYLGWLLALLLLLTQAGALAHGVKHLPDQFNGDEPACDLCLAFAPIGAGIASTPPAWSPPPPATTFDVFVPTPSSMVFRAVYRSRAPPGPDR